MQSSILKWFSRLFRKLNIWLNASRFGKTFNRFSAFLARLFAESFFGGLFRPTEKDRFGESLFGRLLGLPVLLCRKFYEKTGSFWKALSGSSSFVWLLTGWHSISSRSYGFLLLAFSLSYALLRCVIAFPGLTEWCLIGACIIFALALILINRSFRALFKGSVLLSAFGGLFCEIKKDADSGRYGR